MPLVLAPPPLPHLAMTCILVFPATITLRIILTRALRLRPTAAELLVAHAPIWQQSAPFLSLAPCLCPSTTIIAHTYAADT